MKNRIHIKIKAFLVALTIVFSIACNPVIDSETDNISRGVSIVPLDMTVGGSVTISGPNFKEATAVVFPGNITVSGSDLMKFGDSQIMLNVPSGTAAAGQIIVRLPNGDYTVPLDVKIFVPAITRIETQDVNDQGMLRIGPNDQVTVHGVGLGVISQVIYPGGYTVESINLVKTETTIVLNMPMGGFDLVESAPLQLVAKNGDLIISQNIDWTGEGYVPPELLLFCGKTFKEWTWDDEAEPGAFGNGGYNSDRRPNWWVPGPGQHAGPGHGWGAKMRLELPNKITLFLTNDDVIEGTFATDMMQTIGTWSSGMFDIATGPEELSIVGGTRGNYNGSVEHYPKSFFIVNLTETHMTLAYQYPEEPGTCNFYVFKIIEPE